MTPPLKCSKIMITQYSTVQFDYSRTDINVDINIISPSLVHIP